MTSGHISTIATELSVTEKQVIACAALLDEGATVPFISRYRKEVTGSLDEVAVAAVRDRLAQLRELDKRQAEAGTIKAATTAEKAATTTPAGYQRPAGGFHEEPDVMADRS